LHTTEHRLTLSFFQTLHLHSHLNSQVRFSPGILSPQSYLTTTLLPPSQILEDTNVWWNRLPVNFSLPTTAVRRAHPTKISPLKRLWRLPQEEFYKSPSSRTPQRPSPLRLRDSYWIELSAKQLLAKHPQQTLCPSYPLPTSDVSCFYIFERTVHSCLFDSTGDPISSTRRPELCGGGYGDHSFRALVRD